MDRKTSTPTPTFDSLYTGLIVENPSLTNLLRDENASFNGFVYEHVSSLLVFCKLIGDYDTMYCIDTSLKRGNISDKWVPLRSLTQLLEKPIHTGGDGGVDIMTEKDGIRHFYQVKHSENISFEDTGIRKMKDHFECQDENIILIINDKIQKPNDKKDRETLKKIKIYKKEDIRGYLEIFYHILRDNNIENVQELCQFIDDNYLNRKWKNLSPYFHQEFFKKKFEKNFMNGIAYHYLHYKPRTGKTIIHLRTCKFLLDEVGLKKILIATPYPDTIEKEYKRDLNDILEFKDLVKRCHFQHDGHKLKEGFEGIYFCSLQWTKGQGNLGRTCEMIKKVGFDFYILDEAHLGSLTTKTRNILKTIPRGQYTSGTLERVKEYRNSENSCLYEWNMVDEGLMRSQEYEILKESHCKDDIERVIFDECLHNPSVEKDYSKFPIQILLTPDIDDNFKDHIEDTHRIYGDDKGVDFSKMFQLQCISKKSIKKIIKKGPRKGHIVTKLESEYSKLKLDDGGHGTEFLKKMFKMIYDTNPYNTSTIMEKYNKLCREYNEPNDTKIIILFLPILMENIKDLQEVVREFIIEHELFPNWCIVTSEDNLTEKQMLQKMENENKQLEKKLKEDNLTEEEIKQKMKENGKERVLFLTGLKGGTGSTYNTCSLTIHFDNSSSPEQYMQHLYRGATPKEGHRYFFTFDMNIHRSFEYQYKFTEDLFDCFKEKKTMEACYLYAREYDLLRFNPPEHCPEFKELSTEEREDIYKKDWCNIDSLMILHQFSTQFKLPTSTDNQIDMDLINQLFPLLLPFISDSVFNFFKNTNDKETDENNDNPNENIRPKQKNRKVGTRDKKEKENHIPTDEEKKEIVVKFCELFFNHISFWMFINQISLDEISEIEELIFEILEKFIDFEKLNISSLNKESLIDIMKKISRLNPKMLDSLQRVYKNKQFKQIREQLEKMLIVSEKEKNERGFVITPSFLAEEMVSTISTDFWKKTHSVLDPCCGYGIFPLLVFELFDKHLPIRNKEKRVRTIIEKCIFFSDISSYNVKITKQLLQFHCDKVVGKEVEELKFNCWMGDTLTLNPEKEWKQKDFEVVIFNPPYNQPKEGKLVGGYGGRSLWDKFIVISIDNFLKPKGLLVSVNPPSWRKPEHYLWKKMTQENQMIYLKFFSKKEGNQIFGCSTPIDYFLLEKTPIYKKTVIDGMDKKRYEIDLKKWDFLPSGEINTIKKMLGNASVIYSSSFYDKRRKWVLPQENHDTKEKYYERAKQNGYNYPVIHNMTKDYGNGYVFSNKKNDHFGNKKVILSFGEFQYPYNDYNGKYGMSNICFGLPISNKKEGDDICKAIKSEKFKMVLKNTKWSTFQTDWRMFKYFKQDWYKQFL